MILTGHAGHFCSGNDIKATARISDNISLMRQRTEAVNDCFRHLRALRIPTIAAIHGACVGGGCSLASYCDFRVADMTSRIGITAVRHSIGYPTAHLLRLTSIIGLSAARRWIYSGDIFDAHAARRDGFIDYLIDHDVLEEAFRLAQPLLNAAPLSIAVSRAQFDAIANQEVALCMTHIETLMDAAQASKDRAEAVAAFIEKRKANFYGH